MGKGLDSAKRVINGTHGESWIDSEEVGECYGLQLKVSATKEDVIIPGRMMTDTKLKSLKGTGVIKLYKANSRMAIKVGEALKTGKDVRSTILSALDDPDAYGAERVCVTGVSFDDLILADWEAGNIVKHDVPFTFTGYEYLDVIGVQ